MSRSIVFRTLASRTLSAAVLLSGTAAANVYVVDASGGGQFTEITAAIAFAAPGDVLVVEPGTYAPFALHYPLSIIGYGNVQISGDVLIDDLPVAQHAALVHASCTSLEVFGHHGSVLLQELTVSGPVYLSNCSDVRMLACTIGPSVSGFPGLHVEGSRAEIVASSLNGYHAGLGSCGCVATQTSSDNDGTPGLRNTSLGYVHCVSSSAVGGDGCCGNFVGNAGNGAPGIYLENGSEMLLVGFGGGSVVAGFLGTNSYYPDCSHDGHSAAAIQNDDLLLYSGGTYTPRRDALPPACTPFQHADIEGSGSNEVLEYPALAISGTPNAGSVVTLSVHGIAGATADLWVGRKLELGEATGGEIEILTQHARVVHLGVLPASGDKQIALVLDASWLPGTLLVAQVDTTVAPGDIRRTNSIPLVVR